ncbi:MAG: hypothetical protein ACOH2A_03025 [Sphingobacteriaceae bacterium]
MKEKLIADFNVKPKKWYLAARLIGIGGFDVVICFFAIPALLEEGKFIGVAFSAFFFVLLSWELLTGLFLKPVSAKINDAEITFQYLTRRVEVRIDQLAGYSDTVFQTKMFDYNGLLFYLKDGRKIELSEVNIKSIGPVDNWLKQQRIITHFGEERSHMSCFLVKYKYSLETKDQVNHKIGY